MGSILEGLTILIKYGDGDFSAEHDVVYAGGDTEISEEDKKKLEGLLWFYDNEFQCWSTFT